MDLRFRVELVMTTSIALRIQFLNLKTAFILRGKKRISMKKMQKNLL